MKKPRSQSKKTQGVGSEPGDFGLQFDPTTRSLTHLLTGKTYDLKKYEWLEDYIPDWGTIEFILYGMGTD